MARSARGCAPARTDIRPRRSVVVAAAIVAMAALVVSTGPASRAQDPAPVTTAPVTTDAPTPAETAGGTRSTRTTTNAADGFRTGWYPEEPDLGPAAVTPPDFGLRWRARVDGQVYAQPLAWQGVILIVTAANMAYGFDQRTGGLRWSRSLDAPVPAANLRCADLAPLIGVTSTPVIDPSTGIAYIATKTAIGGRYAHRVHALAMTDGSPAPGFPVVVAGSASNDPAQAFDSTWQHQRPGLALLNGVVYLAFGAHCDLGRYQGWVVGVGTDGVITTLWSAYPGTTDSGAGIWQSGSAPVVDGADRLIVTTGNGFGARSGQLGAAPPRQLAQAVVRLDVQGDGTLRAADFFSPYDAPRLDAIDGDLGASSPLALPASFGTPTRQRLLVQSSKTGYLYLLDRDDLGGRGTGSSGGDRVLSRVGPDGGQWGKSAVWGGDGGWILTVTNTKEQRLHAHQIAADATGRPRLVKRGSSAESFGKLSGTPVVTSDATTPGSAVLWAIHRDASPGRSELRAYSPVARGGRVPLLWRGPIGDAVKFSSPLPVDGQVIVGTADGSVLAFGRPATAVVAPPEATTAPAGAVTMDPEALSLGGLAVGASTSATVTVRNGTAAPLTILGVGVEPVGPVSVGDIPAGTVLASGASLAVPVQVRPVRAGEVAATVTVRASTGDLRVLVTAAAGSAARLAIAPTRIDLGAMRIGELRRVRVQVANTGGAPLAISRSKPPAPGTGWITTDDLPEGTTLAPGEARTIGGTVTATRVGRMRFTWTINADVAGAATAVVVTATVRDR